MKVKGLLLLDRDVNSHEVKVTVGGKIPELASRDSLVSNVVLDNFTRGRRGVNECVGFNVPLDT